MKKKNKRKKKIQKKNSLFYLSFLGKVITVVSPQEIREIEKVDSYFNQGFFDCELAKNIKKEEPILL